MEEIGNVIKNIRKENNLTQSEFASILWVSSQAVSKWENGVSIPDISTLKEISNKFNVDLDYLITGKKKINKNILSKKYLIIILIFTLAIICIVLYTLHKHNYEFKTLNGQTKDINVSGSVTYDDNKSSIYLNVDYNANDENKYNYIKCTLYEKHEDILNIISEKIYDDSVKVS